MLAAEHEAADVLRRQRLNAYALRRPAGHGLGWLLQWLGWRAFNKSSAAH